MYGVCNNKANVCVCVCACVKSHVQAEMGRRIDSLLSDVIFTAPMKEYALQIGFVSVFRYSARLAPWTLTERLELNAMWSQAYTRFWCRRKSALGLDASPILSANDDGGRECPSVIKVWTREVLTVYKQCLFLPGEVSQIMKHHLYQPFLDHGCVSPSQLQQLLRVSGQTHFHSAIALLLLCLDEQGLKVSSRRAPLPGCLIADVIWPHWANYKLPGAPKKSWRGAANWTVHKRAARWRARGCGLRLMLLSYWTSRCCFRRRRRRSRWAVLVGAGAAADLASAAADLAAAADSAAVSLRAPPIFPQLTALVSPAGAAEPAGSAAAADFAAVSCLRQARLQLEETLHTYTPPLPLTSQHRHNQRCHRQCLVDDKRFTVIASPKLDSSCA